MSQDSIERSWLDHATERALPWPIEGASPAARPTPWLEKPGFRARATAILWVVLGVAALAGLWQLVKAVFPEDGVRIGETIVIPRTNDIAMPSVGTMVGRLFEPVTGAPDSPPMWLEVAKGGAYTLGLAGVGWLVAVVLGLGLAVLMNRFSLAKYATLPWVTLSQTVPLIAIAPLVRRWGASIQFGDFQWQNWMSVSVIAAYLAFFPVAVTALRGLESPTQEQRDLMRANGQKWWGEFKHLRVPAAIPMTLTGLRLAAANAVVGAVVAEVSIGQRGGIGRLIVDFAASAGGDPGKPWAPIFGAVAIGLIAVGLIALLSFALRKYRRGEQP